MFRALLVFELLGTDWKVQTRIVCLGTLNIRHDALWTGSMFLRWLGAERRVKSGIVPMVLFRLIQGSSFAFHPSVGLKIVFFFSNADAQTRIYSLSPE